MLTSVRSSDELFRRGYCRVQGFLSPAETAYWLAQVDGRRDAFRLVGAKGGLGLPFRVLDGVEARRHLAHVCAALQPRMQHAAEQAAELCFEPIRDPRRALRLQRYQDRKEGFRWHFDGSHTSALLTLANTSRGATDVVSPRWTPLLKPLFYALYPVRGTFSLLPHATLVAEPGDLLILNGRAVLHRGAAGSQPGERVVLLTAFDPAGSKPRPIRDWIARRFNY